MKYFLSITGAVLAGLVLFSGCRGGHHGFCHHKFGPKRVSDRIASKLSMDKDQKAKLDVLVKRTFDQMPDLKKDHSLVVDELVRQFESDTFDTGSVSKAMSAMEVDMKKAREVMVNSGAEFHKILKPEQKAKIVKKLKRYQSRIADRMVK